MKYNFIITIILINNLNILSQQGNVLNQQNSGLVSDIVNTIYIDSNNCKWIGTDKGLSVLNGDNWSFYSIADHLKHNHINDIAFEKSAYGDELWIATDSGLTVAAYNVDGITAATTYVTENSGIKENKLNYVEVDLNNTRWIAGDSTLNVFTGSSWFNKTFSFDANGYEFSFADYPISGLDIYNPDSMLYATTNGKGIIRYSYEVDGVTGASTYGAPWSPLSTENVLALDTRNELQWYGTDDGIYKHSSNEAKSSWHYYNTGNGFSSNHVSKVHIDNFGNAWFGTNAGLNIFTSNSDLYTYTTDLGLLSETIHCITSDTLNNVWIGTDAGIEWFSVIPGDKKISMVSTTKEGGMVCVYPNPAYDFVVVEFENTKEQDVALSIISMNGRKMYSKSYYMECGNIKVILEINRLNNIKSGQYVLKVVSTNFNESLSFIVK